jgi:hypothetical protein
MEHAETKKERKNFTYIGYLYGEENRRKEPNQSDATATGELSPGCVHHWAARLLHNRGYRLSDRKEQLVRHMEIQIRLHF